MAATLTAGAAAKERTDDVRIVYSDAPADLEAALIDAASRALKAQSKGELRHMHEVAAAVRKDAAAKAPGTWHVIVGSSFGSFVTHEAGTMAYFFVGSTAFLIFKHG